MSAIDEDSKVTFFKFLIDNCIHFCAIDEQGQGVADCGHAQPVRLVLALIDQVAGFQVDKHDALGAIPQPQRVAPVAGYCEEIARIESRTARGADDQPVAVDP